MQPFFFLNKDKEGIIKNQIHNFMQEKGIKYDQTLIPENKENTRAAVVRTIQSGYNPIVAVGGDGTINTIASGIVAGRASAEINLGIIPYGTCNDLVRFLGIPSHDLSQALQIILSGKIRMIDTARMNSEFFINGAGFGRSYQTYLKQKKIKDSKFGGSLYRKFAAFYNTLSASLSFQPLPVKIRVDGQEINEEVFLALVFNGPFFSKGLNLNLGTKIDDRLLDICLLKACPKKELIRFLTNLYRRKEFVPSPNVLFFRSTEVRIESKKTFWPQVDGERPQPEGERVFHCQINPEKLRVLVP